MAEERTAISADDVAVTLAVRRDLGAEHDPAVIAEFLDRVQTAIDQRVDERVAKLQEAPPPPDRSWMAIPSIALGIPITAITLGVNDGGVAGIVSLAIAWAGIAGVNIAHGVGLGRRR